nr:hypothetical protein GCM10010200_007880 [Actinomadura rugatobispora]
MPRLTADSTRQGLRTGAPGVPDVSGFPGVPAPSPVPEGGASVPPPRRLARRTVAPSYGISGNVYISRTCRQSGIIPQTLRASPGLPGPKARAARRVRGPGTGFEAGEGGQPPEAAAAW